MLAPYQPSQRYYVLDVARAPNADLPAGNLVSALIGLEKARDAAGLREALKALFDLLRQQKDRALTRAFMTWLRHGLRHAGRLPAEGENPLAQLQETQTMLEETVREWTREWLEQGRAQGIEQGIAQGIEQGIEQGRHEERALLCRLAGRKFDAGAAEGLAAAPAPASPTRTALPGSATGSSSARRRRTCWPASAVTTGRAAEAPAAVTRRRRGIGVDRLGAARRRPLTSAGSPRTPTARAGAGSVSEARPRRAVRPTLHMMPGIANGMAPAVAIAAERFRAANDNALAVRRVLCNARGGPES